MKPASSGSGGFGAWHQKFLRRERDAMGVGVVQQRAMVGLRNRATGSAAGFLMLPTIRRRQRGADNAVPTIPATLASPPSFLMMAAAGSIPSNF